MLSGLFVSIIAIGAFSGWLYYHQPEMIFFPSREISATPADWGMEFEDVELVTADGIHLHAWYIPASTSDLTLLFFHGNAGNISHRGESIEIFYRLGLNVFIIDYRGYGQSEGRPSEEGFYEDARAAWRFLIKEKSREPKKIIVFGRSLGGAIAARLATEKQPGALILESTFSSAKDMAHAVFPVMSRLAPMRFDFDTVNVISNYVSPLLVIHSTDDEIIPYRLGEKVYLAANQPKYLLKISGDHNFGFILSQPAYQQSIADFLSKYF